jgi:hypothetical protein
MATFLLLVPAILACLLLGAHFMRFYAFGIVAACLLMPLLLLVARAWAARAVQLTLGVGVLVWSRAAYLFVQERAAAGEPWTRLLVIMGGVTVFTAVAGILMETPPVRRRYGLRTGDLFRAAPPES